MAIIQAERVWRLTGNPVWPWELGALPDDWMDAMRAYSIDVERKRKVIKG
jgi:hypothetical protein